MGSSYSCTLFSNVSINLKRQKEEWKDENYSESLRCINFSEMRLKHSSKVPADDIRSLKQILRSFPPEDGFADLMVLKRGGTVGVGVELNTQFFEKLRSALTNPVIKVSGDVVKQNLVTNRMQTNTDWTYQLLDQEETGCKVDDRNTFTVSFTLADAAKSAKGNVLYQIPFNEFKEWTHPDEKTQRKKITIVCSISVHWDSVAFGALSNNHVGNTLYQDEDGKDVTIVCSGGEEVKCHSMLLQGFSDVFKAMLSKSTGMMESQTRRIELGDISHKGAKLLVQHLYGVEVIVADLTAEDIVELFEAAHQYGLSRLEEDMANILLHKNTDWFTADDLLRLYVRIRISDKLGKLKKSLLKHMTSTHRNILSCDRSKSLNKEQSIELCGVMLDMKFGNESCQSGKSSTQNLITRLR